MNHFKLQDQQKIESGFGTPEGYFDGLTEKIMQQLPDDEPKVISIFISNRNWIVAAAAVLVLALMVPIYNNAVVTNEPDLASIENYLTYQSGISQYELIDLLDSEDIQGLDDQFAGSNIEDATIEDILTSNTNFDNYITE